jgi:hypothetical protein
MQRLNNSQWLFKLSSQKLISVLKPSCYSVILYSNDIDFVILRDSIQNIGFTVIANT